MTKRFTTDNGSHEDVTLVDNVTGEEYESNFEDIIILMNELNNEKEHYRKQLEAIRNVMGDFDRGYDSYDGMEMFNALGDILKILKEEDILSEKEVIKTKLLTQILDYEKIANDNWNYGLKESVESLHDEVEELFKNPLTFNVQHDCDDCKHYCEIDYPKGECLKHNKEFEDIETACEDFEWK